MKRSAAITFVIVSMMIPPLQVALWRLARALGPGVPVHLSAIFVVSLMGCRIWSRSVLWWAMLNTISAYWVIMDHTVGNPFSYEAPMAWGWISAAVLLSLVGGILGSVTRRWSRGLTALQ